MYAAAGRVFEEGGKRQKDPERARPLEGVSRLLRTGVCTSPVLPEDEKAGRAKKKASEIDFGRTSSRAKCQLFEDRERKGRFVVG